MPSVATAQPQLLSQINERSVLRALQASGPCSRADVTRRLAVTAPTVSKAVASLLRSGLLEEFDVPSNGRGRPARQLRLASKTAQVLGLVIDAGECRVVSAGLDGCLEPDCEVRFPTPDTYETLIDRAVRGIAVLQKPDVQTLGLGISLPGLVDSNLQTGLLSPNVPITNGHATGRDLTQRLGFPSILLQECHALCLAERQYHSARNLDDFAILDATTGVGLGVLTQGRLLTGHGGLAGEIGHLPVVPDGYRCGCGRQGCLETLASDSALARLVSDRIGRKLSIDEIVECVRRGELTAGSELDKVTGHLAFALATSINLFNPPTLFVCSRMFDLDQSLLDRLREQTERLALKPSFETCRIERARGSKREGTIAGIIEYLTDS
ncbi:MAG: ROK family transcriptional regulator, partial [Planctomycetaceae bacterium]